MVGTGRPASSGPLLPEVRSTWSVAMFPELQNALSAERPQFTLITDWKTDGSFLLHHFLSYYLKSRCRVIFVALAQSFSHYNLVAQKLGVNLVSARDEGQLVFLEGLKSYTGLLFSEAPEANSHNPLRFLRSVMSSLRNNFLLLLDVG
ncbi:LOW QUALITY PROTEIN: elongator complex protein 6 [Mantella aurantiaca]